MVSYDGEWVKSPETGTFRFDGSKAKGISVPKNITYGELLDRIYCLLNLDRNEFWISMKFLYASSVPVAPAEIVNDDDVNFFIGENSSKVNLRTPLCVTLERRSSHDQQVAYGEGSSQTFNVMPETQEQTCEAICLLTGIEENEPGFCVNKEREDDDGTSSTKLAPEDVEPQIGVGQPQSTGNATLVDPITTVGPATAAARSSQPQASHKPVQWVTTKEDLTASFTIQQKNDVSLNSSFAKHSDELEVRQVFSSKKELQEKLSMLAIRKNFEYKVERSCKKFLVISCIDENCQWKLRACRYRDNTSFQIRKLVKDHTCSIESRYNVHRQASSWVIGQHMKSKCQGTDRTYKPKEIIEEVRKEFGVNLTYEKAWRAREIALNSDGGTYKQRASGLSSGRPKKRKEPSAGEDQTAQQKEPSTGADRTIRKCRKCGEVGHYSKTCATSIVATPSSISGGETQDKVAEN